MANILVIEDDMAVHSLIKETLELHDFSVFDAYSGTEGLLIFKQNQIDLILLDLMLPGMSGEELIRKIRSNSTVPVIAVSAKVDQDTKLDLLTHGADDYITKPFDLKELLARVEIQLRHSDTATPLQDNRIHYQTIDLDTDTREVTVSGRDIHLTSHEFSILELLLRNPKKVFSRSNLYESVWHEPYLDNDKTVSVHVSNLRSKLNQFGAHYIETVWGIGFKLEGESNADGDI